MATQIPMGVEETPEQPPWQPSYQEREVKGLIERHKNRPLTEEEIVGHQLR